MRDGSEETERWKLKTHRTKKWSFLGRRKISKRKRATSWGTFDWVLIMWILEALPCSRSSLYGHSHRGRQVNHLLEICSHPANQWWPRAAVGKGDASVREEFRVQNKDKLTRDNGSVMDMLCKEDRSSTPSCLLLPPLSSCAASLTPNTHCVFPTLELQ